TTTSGESRSMRSSASLPVAAHTTSIWRPTRARSTTFRTLRLSSTTSTFGMSLPLFVDRGRDADQQPVDALADRRGRAGPLTRATRQEAKAARGVGVHGREQRGKRRFTGGAAVFGVHDLTALEGNDAAALRQRQDQPPLLAAHGDRLRQL